jgi:hypothetical protein
MSTSSALSSLTARFSFGDDLTQVIRTFGLAGTGGLAGLLLFSATTNSNIPAAMAVFGGAVLIAGAFAFMGGLVGFLFAIPRSRQDQGAMAIAATEINKPSQRLSDYAANTNLEQVSDWLTKILIGITLTQFGEIEARFKLAGTVLAPALGSSVSARPFTLALMAYFIVWGFFFAYLVTRLWLPKALSRAEREEEIKKLEVEKEADLRIVEQAAYEALYESPPNGFRRAIEIIEAYHKPGSLRSAWLWLYLAAAYGQSHAFHQSAGNQAEADAAKEKAVGAVQEALRLNPGTQPILAQLYLGKDPNENDLQSLKGDPRLDKLLHK